jgi:hypothetical protein
MALPPQSGRNKTKKRFAFYGLTIARSPETQSQQVKPTVKTIVAAERANPNFLFGRVVHAPFNLQRLDL